MANLPRDSRSVAHAIWGVKLSPEIEARVLEFCREIDRASNSSVGYNFFYGALSTQANKSEASCRRLIELLAHQDTTTSRAVRRGACSRVSIARIPARGRRDGEGDRSAQRRLPAQQRAAMPAHLGDARAGARAQGAARQAGRDGRIPKAARGDCWQSRSAHGRNRRRGGLQLLAAGRRRLRNESLGGGAIFPAVAGVPAETPEIEVEWRGKWWPAKVLKKEGDTTLIHYVGFGSEWDEAVPANRIRPIKCRTRSKAAG